MPPALLSLLSPLGWAERSCVTQDGPGRKGKTLAGGSEGLERSAPSTLQVPTRMCRDHAFEEGPPAADHPLSLSGSAGR